MKKPKKRRSRNGTVDPAASKGASTGTSTEMRFSIGDLADELGVTTRTIRFYETKGLISPARNGVARSYSRRDRARLILILRGTNLGFSLGDIKAFLELYDADPTRLTQLKMLETKLDEHIDALKRKRADLDRMLKELGEIRGQVEGLIIERENPTG